jgi:hypothetical protein
MPQHTFLHNLVIVLIQSANKMGLLKIHENEGIFGNPHTAILLVHASINVKYRLVREDKIYLVIIVIIHFLKHSISRS